MIKLARLAWALLAAFVLCPLTALAHGGGLDGLGCHHDRKRGGYHCHRGPLAGRSFASKAEAQKALDAQQANTQSQQQRPSTTSASKQEAANASDEETRPVYITRTGAKYHGPNCSYLRSRIPVSLKEARAKGYTPCSRCRGR